MINDLYKSNEPKLTVPEELLVKAFNRAFKRNLLKSKGLLHIASRWGHSRLHKRSGFNHTQ